MLAQVLAIIIFLAMFLLIILEIWERQWITLACGLLTLLLVFGLGMHSMGAITRTLNLQSFFTTGFWYRGRAGSRKETGGIFLCGKSSGNVRSSGYGPAFQQG